MQGAGHVIGRSERRLVFALAASALLHGALMQAMEGAAPRSARVTAAAPLSTTLNVTHAKEAERIDELPMMRAPQAKAPEPNISNTEMPPRVAAPTKANSVQLQTPALNATLSAQYGDTAITQPSDPTYYGARSLDVFPRALTDLDWRGAIKARATVFIDESGTVNEVRAIQAQNTELETAARELLFRTRFTPAYKDGRVVKAQVMVSLE